MINFLGNYPQRYFIIHAVCQSPMI